MPPPMLDDVGFFFFLGVMGIAELDVEDSTGPFFIAEEEDEDLIRSLSFSRSLSLSLRLPLLPFL